MKKERISLSQAEREFLVTLNNIWSKATLPLFRMYLIGIAAAFAVMIGGTYLLGWKDGLATVILLVVAILTYLLIRLMWANICRNLDLVWNQKYRQEIVAYALHQNEDGYTATVEGWKESLIVLHVPANGPLPNVPLIIEYTPVSKTVL